MEILFVLQLIVSFLLIVVIVLQSRGNQSGVAFGSQGGSYTSKKGFERFLFYSTVVLGVIFASISIFSVLI